MRRDPAPAQPCLSTPTAQPLSDLAVRCLRLIAIAADSDAPLVHAVGLASAAVIADDEARMVVTEARHRGWLYEPSDLVPRRVIAPGEVPDLRRAPARPVAENRRRSDDLAVYEEIVKRFAGPGPARASVLWGRCGLPMPPEAVRRTVRRLRDPTRPGGALLWPYGVLLLTPDGEAALGVVLGTRRAS